MSSKKLGGRTGWVRLASAATCGALLLLAQPTTARAQQSAPATSERSKSWDDATTVLAISAAGLQLVMPRIFYSDPEVTEGWKARWHLSVLAPSMTLAALTLINEQHLKKTFKGHRPDCDDKNQGFGSCDSYGMFSSHSLLAFSAFGQGLGVFLVDTTKWSGGRLNAGSLIANVAVPGVLGVVTTIGRTAGNWETGGQAWGSAGVGALVGLGLGALYATLQRPECGYGGDLFCW